VIRYQVSDGVAALRALPPQEQERLARLMTEEQARDSDREEQSGIDEAQAAWLRREVRTKRGWSGAEFGRRIGVSRQHVARLLKGTQQPSTELCERIAREFGITTEEVLRGVGHLQPLPADYDVRQERRLLESFRQLDRTGRAQLLRFAEFLVIDLGT
jgi:transcriptional regulator with XRE-family HTH domain